MLDRRAERHALHRILDTVRLGRSQALVLRGEAGVGKTALLDDLTERASGLGISTARAVGIQSEMELAFAGLHQLCAPLLGSADTLPVPQRDALHAAFGLTAGPAPDRFLVGLAVLGLLAEAARARPLVCLVDDAQWLDRESAQTLAFVARRLVAESVALIFAVRGPGEIAELEGVDQLVVEGLPAPAARALLTSVLHVPMDDDVLDRIVAEARGNPLALLELPAGLTPAELAEGFCLAGATSLPKQIEESYQHRLAQLDPDTLRLLLVAALEPAGDPVMVWRAAELLGLRAAAAGPAAAAGLVRFGAQVRFRHPLVRSAVYRVASQEDRRRAHWALAQVTDPEQAPERRAWHAAQATAGPHEDVATELERAAGRTQARGGLAAAAALLERAAELTEGAERRAQRTLAAAQVTHDAGMPESALRLLSLAEAGPLGKLAEAKADLLHARITLTVNRGRDAPPLLLNAARQFEQLDVRLARQTYLDALLAAMFAGALAPRGTLEAVAVAARSAPSPPHPSGPADLLLDGLAVRFTDGYTAALPILRHALTAFRRRDLSAEELRWLWLAHITAGNLWDEQTLDTARHVRLARDTGALTTLPLALASHMGAHVYMGDLAAAQSLRAELDTVAEAIGLPPTPYGALLLTAWQGDETQTAALIDATTAQVRQRGEGFGLTIVGSTKALLHNSLAHYDQALIAARAASDQPPAMGVEPWLALTELIEAASRLHRSDIAADAYRRLAETAQASGTDWGLGMQARARALRADGPAAEDAYREAVERLARTRIRGELARAHLLYGEWLRRQRRRLDAREQLRIAYEMFTAMGMAAFAERTARELRATGETARKRSVDTGGELTAQEAQITRLVREDLSNAEIGARLFISPRTVEWHLSRIYDKLHVTSRRQLLR